MRRYKPGDGILPHTDGPAYAPLVATLSLGSHTILSMRPSPVASTSTALDTTASPSTNSTADIISLLLPPRSLLLLSGELYGYMHGIETYEFDKMETLKACLNWEEYWDEADGVADFSSDDGSDDEEEEEKDEVEKEAKRQGEETEARLKRESIARRRFVEDGDGWERGRRISLTCRRVTKVRKGIKLG